MSLSKSKPVELFKLRGQVEPDTQIKSTRDANEETRYTFIARTNCHC